MKSNRTRYWLTLLAMSAALCPLLAQAEMHLYWHWEGGGGESCGPLCTTVSSAHIVIDGWREDGTGSQVGPYRFTMSGRGGGGSKTPATPRVTNPADRSLQCTLTTNMPGIAGLPPGTINWLFFVEPTLDPVDQAAFREAANAINASEKNLGHAFRLVEIFERADARYYVGKATVDSSMSVPAGVSSYTRLTSDRDGSVRFAATAVEPTTDTDFATSRAINEFAKSLGLADISVAYDANYPSAMFPEATRSVKQRLDACTAAVIDSNVNRWDK